jgi:menaquinone-9 beta-reductase
MVGASYSVDLLIVGGGIAGSTLARAMAVGGAHVLVAEKETAFRDRIRGEVLLPWGSVEAKALDIYEPLLATCGREAPYEIFCYNGEAAPARDFRTSTPKGTCVLSFYHPSMQEELANSAKSAGAEVWRGAALRAVHPGTVPEVEVSVAGQLRRVRAKLVVGADGRDSTLATQLGFEPERTPQELFTTGLQFSASMQIQPALYFLLHGVSGRGSVVIQNGPRNYRIYLFHHKDALPRRLSGSRDYAAAFSHFRELGVPAEWLDAATPHGILASFDGAFRWITTPAKGNCVLVGDAAATTDPVWGNGLSRTLRDVRLLRDRLLDDGDWAKAALAYASDHDAFYDRLRRAEQLKATLLFSMGEAAEERRLRAFKLMKQYPELNTDLTGLGPEAAYSNRTASALLDS